MTTPVQQRERELLARMERQIEAWEVDEPRSDWWSYQRDYVEAFEALSPPIPDNRVRVLEEALRPFADEADWAADDHDDDAAVGEMSYCRITIGQLRRARTALSTTEEEG